MAVREGEIDDGRIWFNFSPSAEGEESAGELTVGVTLVTADQLGEIERVTFPDEGDKVTKGDILFSLEGTMDMYDWSCPLSATVTEVNPEVLENPELLNEDPQDAGWLVRLEVQEEKDLDALLKQERSADADEEEEDLEEDEDEELGLDEEWEDEGQPDE